MFQILIFINNKNIRLVTSINIALRLINITKNGRHRSAKVISYILKYLTFKNDRLELKQSPWWRNINRYHVPPPLSSRENRKTDWEMTRSMASSNLLGILTSHLLGSTYNTNCDRQSYLPRVAITAISSFMERQMSNGQLW